MGTASPITCPWQTFEVCRRATSRSPSATTGSRAVPPVSASRALVQRSALQHQPDARDKPQGTRADARRGLARALRTGAARRRSNWLASQRPEIYDFRQVFEDTADPAPRAARPRWRPAGRSRRPCRPRIPIKFLDMPISIRAPPPPLGDTPGRCCASRSRRSGDRCARPARSDSTRKRRRVDPHAFRDSARRFRRADQLKRLRKLRAASPGFERAVWQEIAEAGWLSILVPRRRAASDWACAKLRRSPRKVGVAECRSRS